MLKTIRKNAAPTLKAICRLRFQITLACCVCRPSKSSRSEEHTSELQSQSNLVCRLLLEKKKISRVTRQQCTPETVKTPPHSSQVVPDINDEPASLHITSVHSRSTPRGASIFETPTRMLKCT